MKLTDFGLKQIESKQVRADLMAMAVAHLFWHHTPEKDLRDSLSLCVARLLAGSAKSRSAMPPDLYNLEEFEAEHAELIRGYIDRTLDDARATQRETENK